MIRAGRWAGITSLLCPVGLGGERLVGLAFWPGLIRGGFDRALSTGMLASVENGVRPEPVKEGAP
jgi:hypothetical protein